MNIVIKSDMYDRAVVIFIRKTGKNYCKRVVSVKQEEKRFKNTVQ